MYRLVAFAFVFFLFCFEERRSTKISTEKQINAIVFVAHHQQWNENEQTKKEIHNVEGKFYDRESHKLISFQLVYFVCFFFLCLENYNVYYWSWKRNFSSLEIFQWKIRIYRFAHRFIFISNDIFHFEKTFRLKFASSFTWHFLSLFFAGLLIWFLLIFRGVSYNDFTFVSCRAISFATQKSHRKETNNFIINLCSFQLKFLLHFAYFENGVAQCFIFVISIESIQFVRCALTTVASDKIIFLFCCGHFVERRSSQFAIIVTLEYLLFFIVSSFDCRNRISSLSIKFIWWRWTRQHREKGERKVERIFITVFCEITKYHN